MFIEYYELTERIDLGESDFGITVNVETFKRFIFFTNQSNRFRMHRNVVSYLHFVVIDGVIIYLHIQKRSHFCIILKYLDLTVFLEDVHI